MNKTKFNGTKKTDLKTVNSNLIKISKDILLVIFTHNDDHNLVNIVNDIKKKCGLDFIIADKGSTDGTLTLIKKNKWNYIELNSTKESNINLLKQAIEYAKNNHYRYIIQYDLKKQYNYGDLLSMAFYSQKGYDFILSARYYNQYNKSNLLNKKENFIKFIFKIKTKQKINDPSCNLMMFNWVVMDELLNNKKLDIYPSGIAYVVKKKGLKIKEIPTIVYSKDKDDKKETNNFLIGMRMLFLIHYKQWGKKNEKRI